MFLSGINFNEKQTLSRNKDLKKTDISLYHINKYSNSYIETVVDKLTLNSILLCPLMHKSTLLLLFTLFFYIFSYFIILLILQKSIHLLVLKFLKNLLPEEINIMSQFINMWPTQRFKKNEVNAEFYEELIKLEKLWFKTFEKINPGGEEKMSIEATYQDNRMRNIRTQLESKRTSPEFKKAQNISFSAFINSLLYILLFSDALTNYKFLQGCQWYERHLMTIIKLAVNFIIILSFAWFIFDPFSFLISINLLKKIYSDFFIERINNLYNLNDFDNLDNLKNVYENIYGKIAILFKDIIKNIGLFIFLFTFYILSSDSILLIPIPNILFNWIYKIFAAIEISSIQKWTQILTMPNNIEGESMEEKLKPTILNHSIEVNFILFFQDYFTFYLILLYGIFIVLKILQLYQIIYLKNEKDLYESKIFNLFKNLDTYTRTGIIDNYLKSILVYKKSNSILKNIDINQTILFLGMILIFTSLFLCLKLCYTENQKFIDLLFYMANNQYLIIIVLRFFAFNKMFNKFIHENTDFLTLLTKVQFIFKNKNKNKNTIIREINKDLVGLKFEDNIVIVGGKKKKVVYSLSSLSLNFGNLYIIIGESGGGKSTFLKTLSTQMKCSGKIYLKYKDKNVEINDIPLFDLLKLISFCGQFFYDVPSIPLDEYLQQRSPYYTNRERFDHILQLFDLGDVLNKFPDEYKTNVKQIIDSISGGQKARLLVIFKILSGDILMIDEALDTLSQSQIIQISEVLFCYASGVSFEEIPLDPLLRNKLVKFLKTGQNIHKNKKLILIISHNLRAIQKITNIVDKIIQVQNQNINTLSKISDLDTLL